MYHDMVHLYRIPVGRTSRPAWWLGRVCQKVPLQRLFRRLQAGHDRALVLVESLRRYRHRDGDDVADRVAGDDPGGADPERMLLAVDGDAGFAHGLQVAQQILETRQRPRCALLVAGADEFGDRRVVEGRQIGLAVGGAIERKRLADRRYHAQPLRADHLIDENQVILLHHRKIDRLLELAGELHEVGAHDRHEVGAG